MLDLMCQMWFRSMKPNGAFDMNNSSTDRSYFYFWYYYTDLPGLL
jgi:hypothetical protein